MVGWAFRQVVLWSAVIGAAYYAMSHWQQWVPRRTESPSTVERTERAARGETQVSRTVVLRADRQGHFWIDGRINQADVRFIIDTGATGIALSREDATRAGLHLQRRDFTLRTQTANGVVRAAPVQIRTLEVGPVTVRGIQAHVVEGPMTGMALLGMSFLRRLESFEVRGDTLTLRW